MISNKQISSGIRFTLIILATAVVFMLCLLHGSVEIPAIEIFRTLFGADGTSDIYSRILFSSRIPMAIVALLSGMALSVSGLLLQTTFRNPLADPTILGVSSGSGLGVAVVVLGASGFLQNIFGMATGYYIATFTGAVIGALVVISLLLLLSSILKNATVLLIAGIMIGYLASSAISLLSYFSPSMQVKAFTIWGLGSYADVTMSQMPIFAIAVALSLCCTIFLIKPLNALLLGERYASSMGYNLKHTRTAILLVSGLLTAVTTAFCGPIGFIGLIVPHIARMIFSTSNHNVLFPATIITGALISLICLYLSTGIFTRGIIPINAVTPIIGVPIILYILLNRNRLRYFQ